MPQVDAWHSIRATDPKVYHDNDACTEGNNIEKRYRRLGKDGRRICDHCKRLDSQGK